MTDSRVRPTGSLLVFYTVLATLLTMLIVQYSRNYGRLLVGPLYDDVVYLNEGLHYAQVAQTQGPRALVELAVSRPPHSPFATFVAGVSFLLFGPELWAPYALMGLAVLAVLLAADRLLAGLPWHARAAGAVFVLTFPIVGTLPYHFRPDAAAGLATAFGVAMMLRTSPRWAPRWHQIWTGSWFALALVVKAPVLPFTVLMFAGSWWLSLACGRRTDLLGEPGTPVPPAAERNGLWGSLWPYALPVLLLAGPYYLLSARRVYHYIYDQVFGRNRDLWVMDIDWLTAARFVWDGQAGQLMLGRHGYVVLALAMLTAAAWLWRARGRVERATVRLVLAMLGALFLAWLVPTWSRYGNPFTGSTFSALVMFAGVLLLRSLFLVSRTQAQRPARRPEVGAVLGWCAVAAALACFKGPIGMGNRSTESVQVDNRVERIVYRTIVEHAAGEPATVFLTSAANLSADLLRFRALADHVSLSPSGPPFSTNLDDYRSRIAASRYVVSGEAGAFRENRQLPFYALQDELVAELRSDPALELLVTVPAHDGLDLYVFGRRPAADGATAPP
jgi:hypothetical protein